MRKPIIAGNWKMNLDYLQGTDLFLELNKILEDSNFSFNDREVVVIPSFTSIRSIQLASEKSQISYGAQDISANEDGAFTGEVSGSMLKTLGVKYVLVGHSERRQYHSDKCSCVLVKKIKQAFNYGFTPIFCVGEPLEIRQENKQIEHVFSQLEEVLSEFSSDEISKIVIAYEPVWAIGTGETATAEDAEEVCEQIRCYISKNVGEDVALKVRIQYGGSVKSSNAAEIMNKPNIDGLLVGGAALKADEFAKIAQF